MKIAKLSLTWVAYWLCEAEHPILHPLTSPQLLGFTIRWYINVQNLYFINPMNYWRYFVVIISVVMTAYLANILTWRILRFLEKSEEELERKRRISEVGKGSWEKYCHKKLGNNKFKKQFGFSPVVPLRGYDLKK